MTILGIGTDIASIARFQENIDKHGERFVDKILSDLEKPFYAQSNLKAQFIASRFAAKEALAKAMGTGFREGIIMPDIAILSDALGRPYFQVFGKVQEHINRLHAKDMHLSISHEKEFVLAFAMLSA